MQLRTSTLRFGAGDSTTVVERPRYVRTRPMDNEEQQAESLADRVTHTADATEAGANVTGQFAPVALRETAAPVCSPGQPLDEETRAFMEPRFLRDFGSVRVHADNEAAESASALGTQAYTVGGHIVLGAESPAPHTDNGRRLLAHELAHVIQQSEGGQPKIACAPPAPGVSPTPAVAPITAVINYSETTLPDGRIEMRAWGKIGDSVGRPGLELKFPSGTEVGLPGFDRWHLAGPDATGAEAGIAYAPLTFNRGETARVENVLRSARAAIREQGGECFYDFTAICRVQGEHEGIEIRVLESISWKAEVRAAGSDKLIPILQQTSSPVVSGPAASMNATNQAPPQTDELAMRPDERLVGEHTNVPENRRTPLVAEQRAQTSQAKLPGEISAGRRAVVQWGDDPATVNNAEALRFGARTGPNAAGTSNLLHHRELAPGSLVEMREVAVVIHGEPAVPPGASRVRPDESAPRADVGVPGLREGQYEPVENVTPEAMASSLVKAGFGKGRWSSYRVRLVMCFGGVGKADSYASRLASALASLGVKAETMGGLGRVSATGTRPTVPTPREEGQPRTRARPQPGIPQAQRSYQPQTSTLYQRPGQGWQRVPPGGNTRPDPGKTAEVPTVDPAETPQQSSTLQPSTTRKPLSVDQTDAQFGRVTPAPSPIEPDKSRPSVPSSSSSAAGRAVPETNSAASGGAAGGIAPKDGTSSAERATAAKTSASVPAAKAAGRTPTTRAEVGKALPMPASPRAEAIKGAITLANEYIRKGLEQSRAQQAMTAAWNDYYKEKQRIVEDLWNNPGQGMIVQFVFEHVPAPIPDMAANVKYQVMNTQMAESQHASVPMSPFAPTEKATPFNVRVWIPPQRGAQADPRRESSKAGPSEATANAAPVAVSTAEAFMQRSVGAFARTLDWELASCEALQVAKQSFPGYEVEIAGQTHTLSSATYGELLTFFESTLAEKLGARAERLAADIQYLEQKLGEFLSEGVIRKTLTGVWKGGRDIELDPQMFDSAKAHLSSAQVGLSRKVFRGPLDSLRAGEALVASARQTLVRYATGYTPP